MTKQYPLPLPHHEAMEAEDFMVTASNSEAFAWIDRWPHWASHALAIFGPAGSGKTHLMNVWVAKNGGKILTAADLIAQDYSGHLADNRMVAVDDADTLIGVPASEEILFHLFNLLREERGFLLLTGQHAPSHWNIALPDLRSRLSSIPAAAIAAPDDALLRALLIKQFRDRQIDVGTGVIDYLLPRIERTPAALRALIQDLDRTSLAEGRAISVALARRLLEDQPFLNS